MWLLTAHRFAWLDGKIEHICPEDDEEPWVLNIKRGILSSMQNSMPSFDRRHEDMEVRAQHQPLPPPLVGVHLPALSQPI